MVQKVLIDLSAFICIQHGVASCLICAPGLATEEDDEYILQVTPVNGILEPDRPSQGSEAWRGYLHRRRQIIINELAGIDKALGLPRTIPTKKERRKRSRS